MLQDFPDKGLGPGRRWTVMSQVTLSDCLLADATSGWCVQIFALKSGDADIAVDEIGWLVLAGRCFKRQNNSAARVSLYIHRHTSVQLIQKCLYSRHACV